VGSGHAATLGAVRGHAAKLCVAAVMALAPLVTLVVVAPAPALGGSAPAPVTVFPAAGHLETNGVRARSRPDPHARVLRLIHYFRRDYRLQEILAVASRVGSDGQTWYRSVFPAGRTGGWAGSRRGRLG